MSETAWLRVSDVSTSYTAFSSGQMTVILLRKIAAALET
jgi:hypothetical protein